MGRRKVLSILGFLRTVAAFAALAFGAVPALSQSTLTPNVGFQIPAYQQTNWQVPINFNFGKLDNLFGGSSGLPTGATPTIGGFTNYITGNTSTTTITNFVGGFPGQTIQIFCGTGDTFTQIASSATISVSGTFSCASSKSITLTYIGTVWKEVSRTAIGAISSVTSVSCGNLANSFTCSVANPSSTPTLSFSPVLTGPSLDCSAQPGADMGARLNACLAALPTDGGIADATKFTSPQTISTPVVNSFPAVIKTCGLEITKEALISLSGLGSSWIGCPNQITTITSVANGDVFDLSASNNSVQYVSINGNRSSSFTGNGITLEGSATNALIENDTIFSEQGNDINDLGSTAPTFTNLQLSDYGTNGVFLSGSFLPVGNNISVSDAADSTGSALSSTAVIAKFSNFNTGFLVGNAPAILNPSERLWMDHSFIVQTNGYPAASSAAGTLQIESSLIDGGGAHGPAILSTGSLTLVNNPTIENAANTVDVVQAGSGNITITGNTFLFQRSSGVSVVNINSGPSIGAVIANNRFTFGRGDTPTGDNWAIRFKVPATGDYLQNVATGNVFFLTNLTTDHGIFFDNSLGNITANFNEFSNNQCVDAGLAPCIVRLDATGRHTIYKDNTTNQGTTELYDTGGSPNDLVIQLIAAFPFSSLPIAGDGSVAACADCSITTPIAAAGTGGIAFHVNGAWTANEATVGGDTHTAEITGNYGPISLLLAGAPTGSYLVTIYTEVSTSVAASTIAASIQYHDDTGAQTQTGASLSGATAGTIQSLTFPVRFVTGTALIYSTSTASSPKYKIFARAVAQ